MGNVKLFDSELKLMDILWEKGPLEAAEIAAWRRVHRLEQEHHLYRFKEAGGEGRGAPGGAPVPVHTSGQQGAGAPRRDPFPHRPSCSTDPGSSFSPPSCGRRR